MRISESALKSVVFFGVPAPNVEGNISYGSTGTLIGWVEPGHTTGYIVTCRHVAVELNNYSDTGFFIRVNKLDGTAVAIPVEKMDWSFPEDPSVDLAAASFMLDGADYDQIYYGLPHGLFDFSLPRDIAILPGDDINIVGLFRLHKGTSRNVAVVHSGQIAVLADPNEKVPVEDQNKVRVTSEVYIANIQTLDGLSGSAAYIHETINLTGMTAEGGKIPIAHGDVKLFGIYQGSWEGEPGKLLANDRSFSGNVRVPVGMGLIVPGYKLKDFLMNHPRLKNERAEERRKLLRG
jgi:hypothetical protein